MVASSRCARGMAAEMNRPAAAMSILFASEVEEGVESVVGGRCLVGVWLVGGREGRECGINDGKVYLKTYSLVDFPRLGL